MCNYSLSIMMTSKCNFSCGHCIASCSTKDNYFRITDQSINEITNYINQHDSISHISFTGGEPTLCLEEIQKIQNKITRDVFYSITTNGCFAIENPSLLDAIKLQEIIFSYDKYHAKFISAEDIVSVINYYLKKSITSKINFTYESPEDFCLLDNFQEIGVKIISSPVIMAGKRKQEKMSIKRPKINVFELCPNMKSASNDRERIFYFPNKGLTPCCGSLLFDELLPEEIVFSRLNEDYRNNKLRHLLLNQELLLYLNKSEFLNKFTNNFNFSTTCELCELIKGCNIMNNIPSIEELFLQEQSSKYYKSNHKFSLEQATILNQKFQILYFYMLNPDNINLSLIKMKLPSSIHSQLIKDYNPEQTKECIDFIITNFYEKYSQYYDKDDMKAAKEEFPLYLSSLSPIAKIYKKHDKIVSVILINRYEENPITEAKTIHIGYWGYDKDQLTKEEAEGIKADWLRFICEQNNENVYIDASVDFFNTSGIKFVEQIGFVHSKFRLKKRLTP